MDINYITEFWFKNKVKKSLIFLFDLLQIPFDHQITRWRLAPEEYIVLRGVFGPIEGCEGVATFPGPHAASYTPPAALAAERSVPEAAFGVLIGRARGEGNQVEVFDRRELFQIWKETHFGLIAS